MRRNGKSGFIREDIGYIGLFRDSEGNIIGLHSIH